MNVIAIVTALLVLGALGLLMGIMLGAADKKFHVETDPRVEQVRACLGGANCGACGFAGCDAFAEAVVEGKAKPNGCPPGGAAAAEAIGEILGVKVEATEPMVARVICQGTSGIAKDRYIYDGLKSCRVAASMAGGPKECRFACIGLGDCMDHCAFDAISMVDGIAHIDAVLCKGCGSCVESCPRNVIELRPVDAQVMVRCRNTDVARQARSACMKACIACGRCVKECKYEAIKVENGFARIDTTKCTRCGDCAKVCPCNCITIYEV